MTQEELEEQLEDAMTVGQLMQQLSQIDPELPVVFAYPSRDYWDRDICDDVTTVLEDLIEWSVYHESLAPAEGEDEGRNEEVKPVVKAVIIRGQS